MTAELLIVIQPPERRRREDDMACPEGSHPFKLCDGGGIILRSSKILPVPLKKRQRPPIWEQRMTVPLLIIDKDKRLSLTDHRRNFADRTRSPRRLDHRHPCL